MKTGSMKIMFDGLLFEIQRKFQIRKPSFLTSKKHKTKEFGQLK